MCDEKKKMMHGGHHHHGDKGRFPKDSLMGIMLRCGHILHHSEDKDPEKFFGSLTQEEQDQLKALLTKVLEANKPAKPEAEAEAPADETAAE